MDTLSHPAGRWPSAIEASVIVADSVRLGEPQLIDGSLYFLETRPREKGRSVLCRAAAGETPRDLLPAPFSARSRHAEPAPALKPAKVST